MLILVKLFTFKWMGHVVIVIAILIKKLLFYIVIHKIPLIVLLLSKVHFVDLCQV